MDSTTISIKKTTRDSLFHYGKKNKTNYNESIMKLLYNSEKEELKQEETRLKKILPKEPKLHHKVKSKTHTNCPYCNLPFPIDDVVPKALPGETVEFECCFCHKPLSWTW